MTVPDPRATTDDRARDRARMGELYRQAKGSEAGLGDLVIEAFDRNIALVHARQLRLRVGDPNAGIADPMQFTLTGLDGRKLSMAGLKGKVVVLDFWATWCAPCRQQHPLLDRVRERFASNPDVVFLSIDTDEDRNAVKRFLEEARWEDRVYFEDGLSRALGVMSIPATIVFGRDGKVFSRLTGFVPGQFVETLNQRISDALR
jgi:thiol-disulfide isomerase/thioredoxin